MNERKIIEVMNYAYSLLCNVGEKDNEITEDLNDAVKELEKKWEDKVKIQDIEYLPF